MNYACWGYGYIIFYRAGGDWISYLADQIRFLFFSHNFKFELQLAVHGMVSFYISFLQMQ